MSYCVNCGVELEQSIRRCPLCNTPVLNPNQVPDPSIPAPFPDKRGEVGRVKKTDQAILISVLIICTALGCGLLNLLVYKDSWWSLYVIGVCAVLWVFFTPAMIYQKLPFTLMIFFDGAAVACYCALIAFRFQEWSWYIEIAVPIIASAVLLIIGIGYLIRHITKSILMIAMMVVLGISIFCVVINLCIYHFMHNGWAISWASIVLTCGIIIAVTLFTIMRVGRLREEVRRRMHI